MKTTFKIIIATISICFITITSSCSPEDGKDGINGTNGINGENGTNASIPNTGFQVVPNGTFDQSIPNITFTKVQFGSEITDDMNAYNPTTSELIIPQNGFYHLSATIKFLTSLPDNSPVIVELRKNGNLFKNFNQRLGVVPSININGNFSLNAGDVITVFIFQNSSLSQNLDRDATKTYFSGFRVY